MNLLTQREARTVIHALQVASQRFRENAKVIREVGAAGHSLSDRAVAELSGTFDGYVRDCEALADKLDRRSEYSDGVIEVPVTDPQRRMLLEALDVYGNSVSGPDTDAIRADVHILITQLQERRP